MEADGIVPELIAETPSKTITVSYIPGKEMDLGQEMTPTEVMDKPRVSWEADPGKFYTLLMVDLDAISRRKPWFSPVKHWLVVNIKGSDVSTGEVIADYGAAGPPKGTGFHRYVFLVFEQKDKMEFDEPKSLQGSRKHRMKFSVDGFMKKYGFERAYAGNYFNAQWDSGVNERNGCCMSCLVGCFLPLLCITGPCAKK